MNRYILVIILCLTSVACQAAVDDAYTKILMHFDSGYTDEASRTWTNVGASINTSTKKFGAGSLLITDVNTYIKASDSEDVNAGTASFTIDCWIYPTAFNSINTIISQTDENTGLWWYLYLNQAYPAFNGYYMGTVESSVACTQNAWNHIAVTRNGTSIKIYLNGVNTGTWSSSGALANVATDIVIGKQLWPSYPEMSYPFAGYIDELRFSKNIVRWNADFTPPTSAYGATPIVNPIITSTYYKALLPFNGEMDLTDTLYKTDRVTGTVWQVNNSHPVSYNRQNLVGYSPPYKQISAQTEIMSEPNSTYCRTLLTDDLDPGAADFSTDFWIMWGAGRDNANCTYYLWSEWQPGATTYWFLSQKGGAGGILRFYSYSTASGTICDEYVTNDVSNSYGVPQHIEVSRTNGELNFFVDGVKKTKTTTVALGTKTLPRCNNIYDDIHIYAFRNAYYYPNPGTELGLFWMDDFRFQKGGGGHTSDFIPEYWSYGYPAQAPRQGKPDDNTLALLHLDGNAADEAGRAWTSVGDFAGTGKFGTGSKNATGTTATAISYIKTDDGIAFGSGDFTVDFWVEFADPNRDSRLFQIGSSTYGMLIQANTGILNFYLNQTNIMSYNHGYWYKYKWYHVAMVRKGNNVYGFLDGSKVCQASFTDSITYETTPMVIGASPYYNYPTCGRIDEFRISDVARWDADFTPYSDAYQPPPPRKVSFAPATSTAKIKMYSNLDKAPYITSLVKFDYQSLGAGSWDYIREMNWQYNNCYMSNQLYVWNPELLPATNTGRIAGAMAAGSSWNVASWFKTPYDANIHPGSGSFCIDFWIYYVQGYANSGVRYNLMSQTQDASNYWRIWQDGGSGGYLAFEVASGGALIANEYCINNPGAANIYGLAGNWHHIEISRTANNLNFFVDGTLKSKFYGQQLSNKTVPTCNNADIYLWNFTYSSTPYFLIDEFRFQKGGGGHTANFVPDNVPSARPIQGFLPKALNGFLNFK